MNCPQEGRRALSLIRVLGEIGGYPCNLCQKRNLTALSDNTKNPGSLMTLSSLLSLDTPLSATSVSYDGGNSFRQTHPTLWTSTRHNVFSGMIQRLSQSPPVGQQKVRTRKKNISGLTLISISDFWIWNLVKTWEWRGTFPVLIHNLPRANDYIKYVFTALVFDSQVFSIKI